MNFNNMKNAMLCIIDYFNDLASTSEKLIQENILRRSKKGKYYLVIDKKRIDDIYDIRSYIHSKSSGKNQDDFYKYFPLNKNNIDLESIIDDDYIEVAICFLQQKYKYFECFDVFFGIYDDSYNYDLLEKLSKEDLLKKITDLEDQLE